MNPNLSIDTFKWAITTSKTRGKHGLGISEDAAVLSDMLQIPVINRDNKGIGKLIDQYELDVLLVEEEDALIAHWQNGDTLTYHPGMAVPRIKHMKTGNAELLIEVLGVKPGDRVLDCTMGMASDAVTISYALGETGVVTALESSPVTYVITSYGLKRWNWQNESKPMRQAMERIVPLYTGYETYLRQLENDLANMKTKPYDVIYFDPMFERPIAESSGIAPLRRVADYTPLEQDILELARKLCNNRVVVKHREGTLNHLRFDEVLGGKYSNLSYGVLYANQEQEGM